jgi:plastocyanin
VPSPSSQAFDGERQLQQQFDALGRVASVPPAVPNVVIGGVRGEQGSMATVFRPNAVTIPVGGTVTWNLWESIVSFDAPESLWLTQWSRRPDGTVVRDDRVTAPNGGGPWDGAGFRSSGLMSGPYTLTFTKAGTFPYRCLVHPDMEGIVSVLA